MLANSVFVVTVLEHHYITTTSKETPIMLTSLHFLLKEHELRKASG